MTMIFLNHKQSQITQFATGSVRPFPPQTASSKAKLASQNKLLFAGWFTSSRAVPKSPGPSFASLDTIFALVSAGS